MLMNYAHPRHAHRALTILRWAYPTTRFEAVVSPLPAYPFRYLIEANGSSFVGKAKGLLHDIVKVGTTQSYKEAHP